MFNGKTINLIRQNKQYNSKKAEFCKTIDLWTDGGIVSIIKENEVEAIESAIKTAVKNGYTVNEYLQYMIDEQNILNEEKFDDDYYNI